MTDLATTFRKPFNAQVAAYRLRLRELRPTFGAADPRYSQHDRAFMVAGAVKADLLADLAAAVDKAIVDGTGFEAFKKDFRSIVEKRGWHGWTGEGTKRGEEWRMRTIYRTNIRTAYMAGRHAQLVDGNYTYWIYIHSGAAHPRLNHLAWDGVALPPDHPFWAAHFPPNGWGCGCTVEGARSDAGIRRMGGDPDKSLPDDWASLDPRTGLPSGIGRGWSNSPDDGLAAAINALIGKVPDLPAEIGAAYAEMWPVSVKVRRAQEFAAFVENTLGKPPQNTAFVLGAMQQRWLDELAKLGAVPKSAEIVMRDRDLLHMLRDSKVGPLSVDWIKGLPSRLGKPDQVFFERRDNQGDAIVLVFVVPPSNAKLVIRLDYAHKSTGTVNILRTGAISSDADIKSLIGNGWTLIDGKV